MTTRNMKTVVPSPNLIIRKMVLLALLLPPSYQPLLAAENAPEWIYSVRPKDTLIHFAKRYLVNPQDWRILQQLNQIQNPYRIPIATKLRVPLSLVKQSPAQAIVVAAVGDVYQLSADQSRHSVAVGQQLGMGLELQTAAKSTLQIQFADGSVVTMQPNSTLKLDALSMYGGGGMVDTKLRLQQGGVAIKANPQHVPGNAMQIFTPTAVAAVRGTDFRLSTESKTTRQETLQGKVGLLAAGQEVQVNKGFGSLSTDGQAPTAPVPLLAAPDTSKLPTQFDSLPVQFEMPTQLRVVGWVGSVHQVSSTEDLSTENKTSGSQLTFNDLPDGQYVLKVRAKDPLGFEGYDAGHQFTLNAQPFSPATAYPKASSIISDSHPSLRWSHVQEASAYRVELAKDAQFKQQLVSQKVASNEWVVTESLEKGQYFWRVASINGDDQGPYSVATNFAYSPMPPAPDINQLVTSIAQNRVYVDTINPPSGFSYEAILDNKRNNQKNVWQAAGLQGRFDFLLREFGSQTLRIRLVNSDGIAGPESIAEFDAFPH